MNHTTIKVQLSGLRPLMFDRYAGDNNTKLPDAEKMYLDEQQRLIMPAVNLYSMLCAENTKSVCLQFFPAKERNKFRLGISSFTTIDPFEIPITSKGEPVVFEGWNQQIRLHHSVARLPKGIPNPKARPVLSLPWDLAFEVTYQENEHCKLDTLRKMFIMGGTLGLGTFRPFFGRYEVTGWERV